MSNECATFIEVCAWVTFSNLQSTSHGHQHLDREHIILYYIYIFIILLMSSQLSHHEERLTSLPGSRIRLGGQEQLLASEVFRNL